MIRIGLLGIGGMGRMHFSCYGNNPSARLHAICDQSAAKLRGEWGDIQLNLDQSAQSERVDLAGIKTYSRVEEILADAEIDLIDICLPTPLHASVAMAAMRAGKHVLCEKPMAMDEAECAQMESVARETGRQLLIGHCLRFWPEYVQTQQIIESGEYGRVLGASFHRSSGLPFGSSDGWMAQGAQSGGAVLDMHIHDVDAALWWFGEPDSLETDGTMSGDLPLSADSIWRYDDGKVVTLHGSWDPNGGPFRMAFRVVMERASVLYDSSTQAFQLLQSGESRDLDVPEELAYQNEIDEMIACLSENRAISRVTPASSRLAVAMTRREMAQIAAKNALQLDV